MLAAWSRPLPVPSRPLASRRPGLRSSSTCSKALATWPEVDRSLTSRSIASGSRTVRSPETLDSSMSRSPDGPRSMAIVPEMVRARTDPPPSATVRSPDTVAADRSPLMAEACTAPETVSASAAPPRAARVISPETVLASTGARSPPTTRLAETTSSWTAQSPGTATDSTALRLPLLVSQATSPGRHGRS